MRSLKLAIDAICALCILLSNPTFHQFTKARVNCMRFYSLITRSSVANISALIPLLNKPPQSITFDFFLHAWLRSTQAFFSSCVGTNQPALPRVLTHCLGNLRTHNSQMINVCGSSQPLLHGLGAAVTKTSPKRFLSSVSSIPTFTGSRFKSRDRVPRHQFNKSTVLYAASKIY